jgi:non-ribosomal peptide synthetase component E (peptide arylation enzyme)
MLDHLGQVLPEAARRFGDKTAIVCDGRAFTFRELNILSARLAASLRGLGVMPGDRVSLYMSTDAPQSRTMYSTSSGVSMTLIGLITAPTRAAA